ncbi:MAG: hypothetical protein E6G94_03720 [Alphaproteobacteria bacterium]|nr:MAG: hypothetical protein E6G94_03720 [Alphaproteobacteria bacterium]
MRAAGAAFALALAFAAAPAAAKGSSVAAIKQRIIDASIADYPGNCPCPYNSASNGSRCGKRSAWNRAGGYSPKCFPSDVTAAEVKAWQRR